jgi:hypothetical protein
MSNLARSVLLVILIPAGAAYSSSSTAQPAETKSQILVRTNVDGKFARYLESPSGDMDGIVLEDGTVARFAPLMRGPQTARFRPGDPVRVTGDVASGLPGPYLVHALVTRIDVPTTRGAISPPNPTGSAADRSRFHRAGKYGKGSLKGNAQTPRGTGTPGGRATDRQKRVDEILVVNSTSPRARKKGRLEIAESKTRDATTGKGKSDSSSQWGRAQETAGP